MRHPDKCVSFPGSSARFDHRCSPTNSSAGSRALFYRRVYRIVFLISSLILTERRQTPVMGDNLLGRRREYPVADVTWAWVGFRADDSRVYQPDFLDPIAPIECDGLITYATRAQDQRR